jgi:hypothetical protein
MGYRHHAATLGVLSGSVWLFPALAASPSFESPPSLAPFTPDTVKAWRFVGIPKASVSLPSTQFDVLQEDGEFALRIQTKASYGTWVHELPKIAAGTMRWRWRLDEPLKGGNSAPDLLTKAGDDAALKVCVMFNHDLQRVPFWERTTLRIARSASGEDLPAATLCYVWNQTYPVGQIGRNPYSARVRFMVLRGPESPLRVWQSEQRDIGVDFKQLFADEHPVTEPAPTLKAIVVGADSDNTQSRSLGWLKTIALSR